MEGQLLVEETTSAYDRGDSLPLAQDYFYDGAKLGLTKIEVHQALAVELAIQSGDLALPWTEIEVERNGCYGYGPTIEDTRTLMAMHPEFTPIACAWAYAKDYQMFCLLHTYRTDGK